MPYLARWHGWLLAALWLLLQVVCWRYYHGPRLYGDGMAYVAYARELLRTGQLPGGHYARYAGYPLFLSGFLRAGLGLTGAALGQTALAGVATWAFYRTARQLAGGRWQLAAGATLGLLLWVEVQAFNAFILTESLFTSLLVLAVWAWVRARGAAGWLLVAGLLLALAAVRPNGFIGLAGAAAAGLVRLWQRGGGRRWAAAGAALALGALGWLALNRWLATFGLLETYQLGDVISGYPAGRVAAPAGLWMPPAGTAPLMQVLGFAAHHPGYFAELAGRKLLYWLGWPKPWYSALHRGWLLLTLPATYALAGRGLAGRSWLGVRVLLGTALAAQALIVALTLEDWEVRFSGPLVPYWLLLAVLGAARPRPLPKQAQQPC